MTDRRGWRTAVVMARQNHGLVRKGAQLPLDGVEHDLPRSAGEIGPADGLHEEGVAGKGITVDIKRHAARRVAGGVDDLEFDPACDDEVSLFYRSVGRGR